MLCSICRGILSSCSEAPERGDRNAKSQQHSLRAFGVSSKRKEVNEMNE
jgi:hypothetical protein